MYDGLYTIQTQYDDYRQRGYHKPPTNDDDNDDDEDTDESTEEERAEKRQ